MVERWRLEEAKRKAVEREDDNDDDNSNNDKLCVCTYS